MSKAGIAAGLGDDDDSDSDGAYDGGDGFRPTPPSTAGPAGLAGLFAGDDDTVVRADSRASDAERPGARRGGGRADAAREAAAEVLQRPNGGQAAQAIVVSHPVLNKTVARLTEDECVEPLDRGCYYSSSYSYHPVRSAAALPTTHPRPLPVPPRYASGRAPLRAVELNGERIGDAGCRRLAEPLALSAVSALYLLHNDITDDGALALADGLKRCKALRELYLNSNRIGDDGVAALAADVACNGVLTNLNLTSNALTDEAAAAVSRALVRSGCKLRSLWLGGRPTAKSAFKAGAAPRSKRGKGKAAPPPEGLLGDDGAAWLSFSLLDPNGCSLTQLSVTDAGIKAGGIVDLANALYANDSLVELNVSGNEPGLEGT